jgi:hypothetical protein
LEIARAVVAQAVPRPARHVQRRSGHDERDGLVDRRAGLAFEHEEHDIPVEMLLDRHLGAGAERLHAGAERGAGNGRVDQEHDFPGDRRAERDPFPSLGRA